MRMPFLAAAMALLSACTPAKVPPADAGPDTSCGLDCAAQQVFGLIINRCFEYSADATQKQYPVLGVWVRPISSLEGNIKTIPVEYRKGGQIIQTDFFTIKNGQLLLLRRATSSQSVTYKTGQDITGVSWLGSDTGSGETISTPTTAVLLDNSTTSVTYRVTTEDPSAAEKNTLVGTFDDSFSLQFAETPGADIKRIFAPGTGFTRITSSFNFTAGGSPTPNYLQRVRDVGPDGGTEFCSLGSP